MLCQRHCGKSHYSVKLQFNPGLETRPGFFNPDSQTVNN
jgi:hypothetical protein